jgi:hypothetical protein
MFFLYTNKNIFLMNYYLPEYIWQHIDNYMGNYYNMGDDLYGYEWINFNNQSHRDRDQPAMIYSNGMKMWYQNNQIHRDRDLPAIINKDTRQWLQHDKLHRDNDRPAFIDIHGTKQWYQHNMLHRNYDLPAIISANGSKMWYQNHQLHRKNLPAIIRLDGSYEWYIHGKAILN